MSDHAHIDCGKALTRVWAYLDGELGSDEAREFEQHVTLCTRCHQAHDFERRLLSLLRMAECRADPETHRLRERILSAIREARGSDQGS